MTGIPSKQELLRRTERLFKLLGKHEFDTALIIGKINQYYLTGTLQDGVLALKKNGDISFFVRKSYERARLESPMDFLRPMSGYRDMLGFLGANLGITLMETNLVPLIAINRLKKYFDIERINPLERILSELRAVKSEFELELMRESGRQHKVLLEEIVPGLLREGMSEVDLLAGIFEKMLKLGHHGVSRFSMFQMEMPVGQIGFGENSIYPTNFDGPGGMLGMCPAVPLIGSRSRTLKPGDLVFVDAGYGYMGYHTDKTQVYSFKSAPAPEVIEIHRACMGIQRKIAERLVPGAVPSEIYNNIYASLPECLSRHFMGYSESVKFLGHGVGLEIDELPVIAKGFDKPLEENTAVALEPKCGVSGVGTVGVEDTYIVKPGGGICLTGGGRDILVVA